MASFASFSKAGLISSLALGRGRNTHRLRPRDVVESVEEICKKLEAAGAKATMGQLDLSRAPTTGPRSYDEIKYRGPDGQIIDITKQGWAGTWPPPSQASEGDDA